MHSQSRRHTRERAGKPGPTRVTELLMRRLFQSSLSRSPTENASKNGPAKHAKKRECVLFSSMNSSSLLLKVKTAKAAKNARLLLLSIGQDWDRHYGSAEIAVRMSGVCHVFSGVLGDLGGSSFQFESLTKLYPSNVRKNCILSRLFA